MQEEEIKLYFITTSEGRRFNITPPLEVHISQDGQPVYAVCCVTDYPICGVGDSKESAIKDLELELSGVMGFFTESGAGTKSPHKFWRDVVYFY